MRTVDPNAYGATWYSATGVEAPPRKRLSVELDVDVCVIGAGLAGLTVAREAARHGQSVVVLEAQSVAWNASGRNLGFVVPGFAASAGDLISRVGPDHARALWALSEAGVTYVREAIRDLKMKGVEVSDGWLQVAKTDRHDAIKSQAELLTEKLGATIELWPADRVRQSLRSRLYFGAIHHPRAFSIHPLNYALGLAAAAEAAGARIFEQTPALEVDPEGVRKRVVTKHGRVRASHVVLAGNVHLAELAPRLARTLVPVHTYVVTSAPAGEALREAIRFPSAVSDTDSADNHYRIVDGDRLIWSGRSTIWRGKSKRYVETLRGDIAHAYPGLRDIKIEYAWTGTLGKTVHGMPQIGEISPGFWLLSGFGSHGLNTSAMGGEIVARGIVDGDTTWRMFSPFELIWAGGILGRVAHQANYHSSRAGELIESWRARRRDATQQMEIVAPNGGDEAVSTPPAAAPRQKRQRRRKSGKPSPEVSAS